MAGNKQEKKRHRSAGKRKGCFSRWASNRNYGGGPSARKLRRIIRSSGVEEAERHAKKHGLGASFKSLFSKPPKWIRRKQEQRLRQQQEGYVPAYRIARKQYRSELRQQLETIIATKGNDKAAKWVEENLRHGAKGMFGRILSELKGKEKAAAA